MKLSRANGAALMLLSLGLLGCLAGQAAASFRPRPALDYLHVPRQRELRNQEIDWIRQLVQLEAGQGVDRVHKLLRKASKEAEELVMRPEEAKLQAPENPHLAHYRRLPELWDLLDTLTAEPSTRLLCSSFGVELMQDLSNRMWGGLASLASNKRVANDRRLFVYLQLFALEQLGFCVRQLDATGLSVRQADSQLAELELKLEQALAGQVRAQDEPLKDLKLAEQLVEVDLIKGGGGKKTDLERMVRVASGSSSDVDQNRLEKQKPSEKADKVAQWLEEQCRAFRFQVGDTFDGFNFARLLMPTIVEQLLKRADFRRRARFLKLNELSRICQQVDGDAAISQLTQVRAKLIDDLPWFKRMFVN